MVQGVGWLQVAKCTQGNIFNSTDEAPASSRHDGIMTVAGLNGSSSNIPELELAWSDPFCRGRRCRVFTP
jgi:hypothetical protein